MRIVCISDTHGLHNSVTHRLPDGDVLVHAGDFCNMGRMDDCIRGLGWINALPYKHRIVIAGNHDVFMDLKHPDAVNWGSTQSAIDSIVPVSDGFHYLMESGVEIDGIKFWGSPYQPEFFNWAFNVPRGCALAEKWKKIPDATDVLITHGPAHGYLDKCPNFANPRGPMVSVGCADLERAIMKKRPKAHICGHIHAGYGHTSHEDMLFVNASICNESYHPCNRPIVFDLKIGRAEIVHTY